MDLKEIQKPVEDLLAETTALLKEKSRSNSMELLCQMNEMTPVAKGKKIRSTLMFLMAGMCGAHAPYLAEIAASMEMFHLSSLIHDDIMDNSEQRRGQKTLNTNMGNFLSVAWGDYLFISSFTTLHQLREPLILDIVFKSARLMVEGQILEVQNSFNFDVTLETYYDIINRKTSSLFAAVAQIVSAMRNDPPHVQEEFYKFGMNFGAIFQVRDDMMDIFSAQTGKDRFRDQAEGKITLPYILLMKQCDMDIRKTYLKSRKKKMLKLLEKYHIQKLCMEQIEAFHRQCHDFIQPFPDSDYKTALLNLLKFIEYRDY